MPAHNFMIEDLYGALRAACLFPIFLFFPGYVAAWLLDVFDFRRRTLAFRAALSISLSIAICPILTYWLGRYAGFRGIWAFYGTAAAAFVLLLLWDLGGRRLPRPLWPAPYRIFAAVAFAWLAVSVLSLIDMQIGDRLYYPASAIDYSLRTALVHSISTTGVPPANPFFLPGHPVALRYHYFWLLLCSLADQAGGPLVSPRQALIGGTFWAGMGLIALLGIYLRLFANGSGRPLNRRLLLGVALLAITGLDILPALFFLFLHARNLVTFVQPSVELWNEHVDWFLSTTISTPHAIGATIACFTGFLLLWHARTAGRYIPLAALAFASATGQSVYVAFSFAIFLAIWSVVGIAKKWYRETAAICIAGVATVLFLLPFLRDLAGPAAGPASGSAPFAFTVREFSFAALVPSFHLSYFWRRILVNGSLLPLNYLLEFGLFFLVARYKWRQHRASGQPLSRTDLAMALMVGTSTLICTFLRSAIGNNDLGWRSFLMGQFVLLLWAVDLFGERNRLTFVTASQRQLLAVFFALGFAGTVTDLALIRFYPVLADRGVVPPLDWMSPDRDFGKRTYAARAAYDWLDRATPATAAIQANPNVVFQDTAMMIYGDRQTVAADKNCQANFGGELKDCHPMFARLQGVFPPAGHASATGIQEVCGALPVDVLVAKDTDAAWSDRDGWVWREKPMYANRYVRLFGCGLRTATR